MDDRDRLIAYLLHEMPEEEREAFAGRWFEDPALYEQLRMAEADLLDRYVRGGLAGNRRDRVERYLLDSEAQRRKLAFAAGLHAALPALRNSRWARVALSAAAALVLVAGLAIWLTLQNRSLRRELASARTNPPAVSAGGIYTVFLPGEALRGSSPSPVVRVPAGAALVRLDVEVDGVEGSDSYAAVLSTAGQTVWNEAPIRPAVHGTGVLVPVWVPAAVLQPANYTLTLTLRGAPVGYYTFTVAAPNAR